MSKKKITGIIIGIVLLIILGSFILTISIIPSLNGYKTTIENTYTSATIHFDTLEEFRNNIRIIHKNKKLNNEVIETDTKTINNLLKLTNLEINEDNKSQYLKQLESHGIYYYESKIIDASENTSLNISISIPHIFYNAFKDNYIITSSGKWLNDNYADHFIIGTKDIGSRDTYGIIFKSSNNNYESSVISSYACITDKDGKEIKETDGRSNGDGKTGFAYELQDYVYIENQEIKYVGYDWFCSCTYDSNFYKYSANAYTYYIHSYDKWYFFFEL